MNDNIKFLTFDDLLNIFPFGKTKLRQLLRTNSLPVVKVGRDYITTEKMILDWVYKNSGKEILY